MTRSGLIAHIKSLGKKSAGLVALALLVVLTVSFSAPRLYSAHAAGWLDKIFGDFAPRTRQRARPRYNQPVQPEYKPKKNSRYKKSRRSRKAYGIGKIDAGSRKKKRTSYRIPKHTVHLSHHVRAHL